MTSAQQVVGLRVVRGPDWNWANQDEGEGHVGTVVEVGSSGSDLSPDRTVVVFWDHGLKTNYRCGYHHAHDLRIFDNATVGICHPGSLCCACQTRDIRGFKWRCSRCLVDLCSQCYWLDCHDVKHPFFRFDSPASSGVACSPRIGSTRVTAKGIFTGATVVRGPDWEWCNQDGGQDKHGKVTDIKGWEDETYRSVAVVSWTSAGQNVYRVGHKGKMDLKYVKAGKGGNYYPEHLPVVDITNLPPVEGAAAAAVGGPISEEVDLYLGERVQVCLDVELLKVMQEGHGGWNPKMMDVMFRVGTVHRVTEKGDIRVLYDHGVKWTFHPAALTRVVSPRSGGQWRAGQSVLVGATAAHILNYLSSTAEAESLAGELVTLESLHADGLTATVVAPNGFSAALPLAVLRDPRAPVGDNALAAPAGAAASPGIGMMRNIEHSQPYENLGAFRQNLPSPQPSNSAAGLANSGSTAKSHIPAKDVESFLAALNDNDAEACRLLLAKCPALIFADLGHNSRALNMAGRSHVNKELFTLLLESIEKEKMAIVVNNAGGPGATCVIHDLAESSNQDCLAVLLRPQFKCDVNSRDGLGRTALHIAASLDLPDVASALLGRHNCDPNLRDHDGLSPLARAIVCGNEGVATLIMRHGVAVDYCARFNQAAQTYLQLAAQQGIVSVCRDLLAESPPLLDKVDANKDTAVHAASAADKHHVISLLIGQGATALNAPNRFGRTPLLEAAECQSLGSVVCLVQSKGDLHHTDNKGNSVLQLLFKSTCQPKQPTVGDLAQFREMDPIVGKVELVLRRSFAEIPTRTIIACYLIARGAKYDPASCEDPELSSQLAAFMTEFSSREKTSGGCDSMTRAEVDCRMCDRRADCLFQPCGHVIACQECADFFKKCYICKQLVTSYRVISVVDPATLEVKPCAVCDELPASVHFDPCGHTEVCVECSKRMKKCIRCQAAISDKLHLSISHPSTSIIPPAPADPTPPVEAAPPPEHPEVCQLRNRLEEMEELTLCEICIERQKNTVFLCGHAFCKTCAKSMKFCAMCRKEVTKMIDIYTNIT